MQSVRKKSHIILCTYELEMILLIDSYDSFSNSLKVLIEDTTGKTVITVQNDFVEAAQYLECFRTWISRFEYIVIGPGPGHPAIQGDVGIISWLFEFFRMNPSESIPILGVCLGFQSLCYAFGNDIKELDEVRHGQIFTIEPVSSPLYGESPVKFESVRYHSLGILLRDLNDEILPLATCEDNNENVVMAGMHKRLPLFGVQYHPESICSNGGELLIKHFDDLACKFNSGRAEKLNIDLSEKIPFHESKFCNLNHHDSSKSDNFLLGLKVQFGDCEHSPIEVCDALRTSGQEVFLLNSASEPGDWSIVGLPISKHSEVITHYVDKSDVVRISKHREMHFEEVQVSSIWDYLHSKMKDRLIDGKLANKKIAHLTHRQCPFLGGYIGLISYEEGQHVVLEEAEELCEERYPDLKLIFIERFLIFDHMTRDWILLSIRPDDGAWISTFSNQLSKLTIPQLSQAEVPSSVKKLCKDEGVEIDFPDREVYKSQFEACQRHLHAGDSYELCLTTQLKIKIPSHIEPWDMYKILALHKNPSPYSSFMSFDDCVLLSSSPERFLSWKDDKSQPEGKVVELRPIKGTVKNDASTTLEMAEKLLKTPKEMGENLMIVDLIRHDLSPFVKSVEVSALMAVEQYKTVYQLVSVIRGELENSHGLDVLAKSLPPGSMTGAPKKRSIHILQDIEALQNGMKGKRRGIYSGVAGYWSITDEADWSVTIRSLYHYSQDRENSSTHNIWRIGAGGAITVLSEEKAEWDEMTLKLLSALQIFT